MDTRYFFRSENIPLLDELFHDADKVQNYIDDMGESVYSERLAEMKENRSTKFDIAMHFAETLRSTVVYNNSKVWYFRKGIWNIEDARIYLNRRFMFMYNTDNSFGKIGTPDYNVRQSIMKDVMLTLYRSNIIEKLSSCKSITFEDGRLFLDGEVRKAHPNDWCSNCVPYSLNDTSDDAKMEAILCETFIEYEDRIKFLKIVASCLNVHNFHKLFYIWYGEGNNGKSIMASLCEYTFDKYCYKMPTSAITGRRQLASGATPELEALDSKRIVFMQEPDTSEILNVGLIKELTGNDSIYVRGLFKAPRNIPITSKFMLITNCFSHTQLNEATARSRCVVLDFRTKFTDNPMHPLERKSDKLLLTNIKYLAPSFMRKLISIYPKYLDEGI
jgi:phage/plasmid-associated DNA primase